MRLVETIGLQLQGDHVKAMFVSQTVVGVFKDTGSICGIGMAQVGGKRVFATCQGPGMYVVDIEDVHLFAKICDDRPKVRVFRRTFHKDVNRFADHSDGGPEEHDAERSAEDRVDCQLTGELDDQGGHEDQQAADEGQDDMPERATGIQIVFP